MATKINATKTTKQGAVAQTVQQTKEELILMLVDALPLIEEVDSNLYDRVDYSVAKAIENINFVPKSELVNLYNEVHALFDRQNNSENLVEASVKPKATLNKSKKTSDEESALAPKEEANNSAKTTKPKAKSNAKVQSKPKKTEGKATQSEEVYGNLLATLFPETINEEVLGTLHRVDETFTMDELRTALNDEDRNLYFCCYWDKKLVKQFNYKAMFDVEEVPTFPFNLDITQALYVCDSMDKVYAVSTYTEGMYKFYGEDLEVVNVELANGETIPVRYSNNMEYAIYEK